MIDERTITISLMVFWVSDVEAALITRGPYCVQYCWAIS